MFPNISTTFLCAVILAPECPSTVQPLPSKTHSYYNRPRLGAAAAATTAASSTALITTGVLRNWPNASNLASPSNAGQLPRQRSVTFEPKPGSAPGDTEVETDAYEGLASSQGSDDVTHRPASAAKPGQYGDLDSGEWLIPMKA